MIRERIGRTALRAYSPGVRQARGLEMLGMLLDAGEQSNLAFVRESGSLVLGGLRARASITARAGTRRLLADSCCQAMLILLMLLMISALSTELSAGPSRHLIFQAVVLGAILACALIGHERIAAIGGLGAMIAIVASVPLGLHIQPLLLATVLVPIVCLLVMVRAPRHRPRDPRRLLWLVPVIVLAALHARAWVGLPEVLAIMSTCGLLRLFHDPRLAIACGLVWITLLSIHAGRPAPTPPGRPLMLVAVTAGLILTAAAVRLWIMRHDATV